MKSDRSIRSLIMSKLLTESGEDQGRKGTKEHKEKETRNQVMDYPNSSIA